MFKCRNCGHNVDKIWHKGKEYVLHVKQKGEYPEFTCRCLEYNCGCQNPEIDV